MNAKADISVNRQNFFIVAAVEQAENVIEHLMNQGIAVTGMEVGRYRCPVIRVRYSPECDGLSKDGYSIVPHAKSNKQFVSLTLKGCLVSWEQPLNPKLIN